LLINFDQDGKDYHEAAIPPVYCCGGLSSDSDSRVVRLFDPAKMPTPGQLKSKIDDHLDQEATPQQHAEGVQALHEALAELRRSLR